MNRTEHRTDNAAQWVLAQEVADWNEADQAKLDAWLQESDGNRTAYLRMRHSWREVDRMGALGRGALDPEAPSTFRRPMRWLVPTAIAASVMLAIGSNYMIIRQPATSTSKQIAINNYVTAVGGEKHIAFPDGSKVQLNTASKVRTAIWSDKREVWVDRGEAFFEVAHRQDTPFIVHAGDRQITVLGTEFAVRREGDKVTVTVLEGRVKVDELAHGRPVRSSVIGGGDIAFAHGDSTLVAARSEQRVEDALAWRAGMLSFDQANLGDIAAEFNRYNAKKLIIVDPNAAKLRIGGMFPSRDPESFVELLRDAYGLHIVERSNEVRISS